MKKTREIVRETLGVELPWCQDNSCHFGTMPNSAGTNGGCSCIERGVAMRPIRMAVQALCATIDKLSKRDCAPVPTDTDDLMMAVRRDPKICFCDGIMHRRGMGCD